jgi:hypothetical protein
MNDCGVDRGFSYSVGAYMSLFSRKPKRPGAIPEPYLRGLRDFGEHLVGARSAHNSGLLADLKMLDFAQEEPEAFVEMLAASIFGGPAHIRGYAGPCCLGAVETIAIVYSIDLSTPAWYQIVDAAVEYLRKCGVPYAKVKPYMRARWEQVYSPNEW